MLRFALYARKSKEDSSGTIKSIEDQKRICLELADQLHLLVRETYEENKTARIPDVRPVYKQLVQDIQAGLVDGVLVWHVDRLARNMKEAGEFSQLLIDGKIKEVRTPFSVYQAGDNILPLLVEQGSAAQYSINLSRNVIRGMESMVEAGGWPHQAKVGYLNARDPKNPKRGIIIKDPERFELMKRGFDLMLSGTCTVRQVVDIMNQQWGFKTRPTPQRPNSPLSYAAAYDIFTNPFYAGFIVHNGVQHKGNHEPMLSISQFQRVQQIVRAKGHPRRRAHPHAFKGLLECGYCGCTITSEQHTAGNTTRIYYHCSDPYLRCTKRGISEARLEEAIAEELDRLTVDPELCRIAHENLLRWLAHEQFGSAATLEEAQGALKQIEQQRANLLDLVLRGLLSDQEVYKAKEAQLLDDRNRLLLEIEKGKDQREQVERNAAASLHFLEQARDRFLTGDPQKKKEIARALGAKYVLHGRDVEVTVHPLLTEMAAFVRKERPILETRPSGSGSRGRADFSQTCYVGRGSETLLDMPEPLKHELLGPMFIDPLVHSPQPL